MTKASPNDLIRVGELASRTGVNPRLLRYYESQGLLPAERSATGQRLFPAEAVAQVRYIRELLDAGLPTRIIRELLGCIHEPGRLERCAVPVLLDHLSQHDAQIAALLGIRSTLQGLIDASSSR